MYSIQFKVYRSLERLHLNYRNSTCPKDALEPNHLVSFYPTQRQCFSVQEKTVISNRQNRYAKPQHKSRDSSNTAKRGYPMPKHQKRSHEENTQRILPLTHNFHFISPAPLTPEKAKKSSPPILDSLLYRRKEPRRPPPQLLLTRDAMLLHMLNNVILQPSN